MGIKQKLVTAYLNANTFAVSLVLNAVVYIADHLLTLSILSEYKFWIPLAIGGFIALTRGAILAAIELKKESEGSLVEF